MCEIPHFFTIDVFVSLYVSLRKKCSYSEFSWSVFSRIWTEYEEIRSIFLYSNRMRENKDQNNSKNGHFSRRVCDTLFISNRFLSHFWKCEKVLVNSQRRQELTIRKSVNRIPWEKLVNPWWRLTFHPWVRKFWKYVLKVENINRKVSRKILGLQWKPIYSKESATFCQLLIIRLLFI